MLFENKKLIETTAGDLSTILEELVKTLESWLTEKAHDVMMHARMARCSSA